MESRVPSGDGGSLLLATAPTSSTSYTAGTQSSSTPHTSSTQSSSTPHTFSTQSSSTSHTSTPSQAPPLTRPAPGLPLQNKQWNGITAALVVLQRQPYQTGLSTLVSPLGLVVKTQGLLGKAEEVQSWCTSNGWRSRAGNSNGWRSRAGTSNGWRSRAGNSNGWRSRAGTSS